MTRQDMEEEINKQKERYSQIKKLRRRIVGEKLQAYRASISNKETKLSLKVKAYFIMLNFIFLCLVIPFRFVICADFQKVCYCNIH